MIFDTLISVLAPYDCLGCMAEGQIACADCRRQLDLPDKRCYKCHEPGRSYATCAVCRLNSPLASVQPAVRYSGLAKQLILKLKFGRARAAAAEIADIMADRLGLDRAMAGYDNLIITHVPTATSRVRQRGYDQSQLIARALSRRSGLPYRRLLLRSGQLKQIGSDKSARHHQLQTAYHPIGRRHIGAARILLVDDVCTTGSSLEAAAAVLLAAGASQVDGMVFAKA